MHDREDRLREQLPLSIAAYGMKHTLDVAAAQARLKYPEIIKMLEHCMVQVDRGEADRIAG